MTSIISKRYSEIFNKYYADTSKRRFKNFIAFFESWIGKIDIPDGFEPFMDYERLSKSIDSYFLDVIKYKEYHFNAYHVDIYSEAWCKEIHEEKKINDSKVAAFTAKWLLKASPIAIIPKDNSHRIYRPENDGLCHINERFALDCSLYALLRESYLNLDKETYYSLFYDFKYRNFDERLYFSRFCLLMELMNGVYRKPYANAATEGLLSGFPIKSDHKSASDNTNNSVIENPITGEEKREKRENSSMHVDHKNENKESNPPKEIKIFIASANDVKKLRDSTEKVISQLNSVEVNFKLWRWERDKAPGFLETDDQFQNDVFKEFGNDCDIFIILFWTKLGKNTVKEFDYFKNILLKKNPNIKFWACEYGEEHKREQAKDVAELDAWLDKNSDSWIPMAGERKSIKTQIEYEKCLTRLLLDYKNSLKKTNEILETRVTASYKF